NAIHTRHHCKQMQAPTDLKRGAVMRRAILAMCLCALPGSVGAAAQWLNYKTPGVPRTRDGKPKLDAPAPRAADGHLALSGAWMPDLTPVEELRRLYGAVIDEEIKNQLPGMEATNVHKYTFNILADFPPDKSPARPETAKAFAQRLANPRVEDLCYTSV